MKKIFICTNTTKLSAEIAARAKDVLARSGIEVCEAFDSDVDMLIAIGGDGAFLRALEQTNYPSIPVLGINTGHLGFFQELNSEDEEDLVSFCSGNGYVLQPYKLLCAEVSEAGGLRKEYALNDICIKERGAGVIKLRVSVGENFVEHFYGDGLIVASSAGSTGYTYSLGGCIVDPRLEALQITPIAPINSQVYRSFTSSLLVPPACRIKIMPGSETSKTAGIFADGRDIAPKGGVDDIEVYLSDKTVNVVRRGNYDFWSKVESKFL